jgi:putative hemolysin
VTAIEKRIESNDIMEATETASTKPVDVTAGDLRIRLAESLVEVEASQGLRYRVFCEEMDARPTQEMKELRREFDAYDAYCDHLLVFDEALGTGPRSVVGTYRLMRREAAARCGQFYSADEYDLTPLLDYRGEILEVGRSCVAQGYRTGSIMQLLWRGIAAYVFHFDVDILFGCASLPGVDPDQLRTPLGYLHHNHLAPPALRPRALAERYVRMDFLDPKDIDNREALRALPPLVKGYLRLGGFVGDGAVVDPEFGTTDVCIVVKTDRVTEKYYRHYSRDEQPKTAEGT